ncbi:MULTISPECIES: hypothetical protein [unclassified Frondihabitans]|uniref:hypothetical protein n=1 Tax=unclassified Frondihabitans TaxID=2626248 RepID=UPI000F4FCE68|nr:MULTISPECIES: hypothetical protein [unclassified Frondihabitans]RPE76515.1 hypothetical protein EDF37_2342 [Frondihabitans sp. PhB153]RPF05210.1 hypothetical protein EDF39_1907 [Frondihabitans sp. PhB161]
MSSTDGQPPLTRRQVRDLERAKEAGEAITGSISIVSGSPVPSAMPVSSTAPVSSRAPGSSGAPAPSSTPASGTDRPAATAPAPGSIAAPGQGPTRRELRAQRDALQPSDAAPVPLRAPRPTTAEGASERGLSDALSHVADIENGTPRPIIPPREAQPMPSAPIPADDVDDADEEVESAGTPAPRSVHRSPSVAEPLVETPSVADAADEGPRRRGTGSTHNTASPSGSAPAPSSVPTVFPLTLSGSENGPGKAATRAVPDPASSPSSSPSLSVPSAPSASSSSPASAAQAGPRVTPPIEIPPVQPPAAETPGSAGSKGSNAPRVPASVPESPTPYTPPTGHWSTQAERDDDAHGPVGGSFSSSTGQHNALILGDDRLPDVTGALNATGEVIITGSIDLPRSLATTGSHHIQRIDGADIDRMLEEGDREPEGNDATPVRASRAVSANTSTRQVVLAGGKPKTNRLPIVATICGAAVVVVIVGGVVVGFVTGVL